MRWRQSFWTSGGPPNWVAALACIAALSIVPSYWAVTSTSPVGGEFSWEVFGVVAVSTSLLAAFTVILAHSPYREVKLQSDDQKLHRTPRVILARTEVRAAKHGELTDMRQADTWVRLEIVNAGEGPAIDVAFHTVYQDTSGAWRIINEEGKLPVILPGTERVIEFGTMSSELAVGQYDAVDIATAIAIEGDYHDVAGAVYEIGKCALAMLTRKGGLVEVVRRAVDRGLSCRPLALSLRLVVRVASAPRETSRPDAVGRRVVVHRVLGRHSHVVETGRRLVLEGDTVVKAQDSS
jgi:hypothetical protein